MSRDEIAVLDGSKCVLQLRGVRPFLSDKYNLTQHPIESLVDAALMEIAAMSRGSPPGSSIPMNRFWNSLFWHTTSSVSSDSHH